MFNSQDKTAEQRSRLKAVVRGGRLVKWKGHVASIAPHVAGFATVAFAGGVLAVTLQGEASAAPCTVNGNGTITINNATNNTGCEVSTIGPVIGNSAGALGFYVYSQGSGRTLTVLNDLTMTVKGAGGISAFNYSPTSLSTFNAAGRTINLTIATSDANVNAPNGDALPKIGVGVSGGSTVNIGTLNLTMNNLPRGSGFGNFYEHYGVVTGSSVNAAETAVTNGLYSQATFDNLNVTMSSQAHTLLNTYPLLVGIRAIQGAGASAGNGSSGRVDINQNLVMNIDAAANDAIGIYISGGDSQVHLNNSQITIDSTSARANAIRLGKTAAIGTGVGKLYSTGNMVLDTLNAPNSGAIDIIWQGALLDANANTSSTTIKAGGAAIRVSGNSDQAIAQTVTSFNNLVATTTSTTADLVEVGTGQRDYRLNVRGVNSNLTATPTAYIIDVAGAANTASSVTMDFSQGYMQGLTRKTAASSLFVELDESATWKLAQGGAASTTANFSNLDVTNQSVVDGSANAATAAAFTLQGNVNTASSGELRLKDGVANDTLTIDGNLTNSDGLLTLDTVLGDDNSDSDVLVITGNSAGSGTISVTDINGPGAQTNVGILVVEVNGASNGVFTLQGGTVAANGWTYSLEQKGLNWYLVSKCSGTATLGCITPDTLGVSGSTTVAGNMEGAGNSDTINVLGNASVTGIVMGGGNGLDNSAAEDIGDTITINTTGTIGGIQGNLGNDDITLFNGAVTGDVQGNEDNDFITLNGGSVAGEVQGNVGNDTIVLQGSQVANITGNDGDDRFEWISGTATGFDGGLGSDTAVVIATEYAGTEVLDGGDDVSTADGMVDTLTISGLTVNALGANIRNWENIVLDGSNFAFTDGVLETGSDAGTGLLLKSASKVDGGNAFALTGNMTIEAGSTFDITGGGAGVYSISGNLSNSGLVTSRDGKAGDVITVAGNYIGGGAYHIDTALGNDASATDKLVVQGSTSGTTALVVVNAGGAGAVTNNGIMVVEVGGASNGTFALVSDYTFQGDAAVVAGAYSYRLYKNGITDPQDGNWYLRSSIEPTNPTNPTEPTDPTGPAYNPVAPVAEVYPQVLLGLNGLPTLQQRVGNRFWSGNGSGVASEGADAVVEAAPTAGTFTEGSGIWGRIEGAHTSIEPKVSTTGADYDYNTLKIQAGIDIKLTENENGALIGGVFGQYGHASADVRSYFGNGDISTDAYGFGGTLTWYGNNGFYVDGQAQMNWFNSDLTSTSNAQVDGLGNLVSGNDGTGYALSVEAGKRIDLNGVWTMTPQAQLVYSSVDFDTFDQMIGNRRVATVSLLDGDSLRGRLGVTLDKQSSWQAENGTLSRSHVYGIGNLYYEFLDGTAVDVSGVTLSNRSDRLWGGIGAGGSYNWNDDRYSIYGEGSVNTSLANFGDSYELKGTLGFRVKW